MRARRTPQNLHHHVYSSVMSSEARSSSSGEPPPPSPEHWIGCGKRWPESASNVQGELARLYNRQFAPPAKYAIDNLYDVKCPVMRFIGTTLRKQSKSITYYDASAYFSQASPTAHPENDHNAPIPSSPLLDKMKNASGQAMLDGARSISHPTQPNLRYPLWILTYWLRMRDIVALQASWASSHSWLSKQSRDPVAATVFKVAADTTAASLRAEHPTDDNNQPERVRVG